MTLQKRSIMETFVGTVLQNDPSKRAVTSHHYPRPVDVEWKLPVKAVRQFALILAIVLPMVTPAMACALPNAHLSPAEHSCCKRMQGHCGSMDMPTSQGCCQKEAPTAINWNPAIQANSANVSIDLTAPAALLPAMRLLLPVDMSAYVQQPVGTLPQSPPSAISILRI